MAKIKLGALVVGVRGTIGGVTYSANASGPHAKVWARPANQRRAKQTNQRGRLAMMPAAWAAISGAQKAAWSAFAADPAQEKFNSLGESFFASGWNWFCEINVRQLRAGLSPIDDPPVSAVPAAPVIDAFIFTATAGPIAEIQYDYAVEFPAGINIVIEGSPCFTGGRQVQHSRWLQVINGIASPTGSYDFTPEWIDIFGLPSAGLQGFLRVYKQTDDGMRSSATSMLTVYA